MCNHISGDEAFYDVAAGTTDVELPNFTFFDNIVPTGINESGHVSANAHFIEDGGAGGALALVDGRVLPPGVLGDVTAGINSAGIVGGQSEGLPVLWIPNP